MRRGAVSVPLNGINVGAGPGRGLAGPRAGGSVVLRIAEWVRAGGVCCGAGRGAAPAASGWGRRMGLSAHHRACSTCIEFTCALLANSLSLLPKPELRVIGSRANQKNLNFVLAVLKK